MRRWLSGSICFVIVGLCSIAFAQKSFYSIHISSYRQKTEADTEVKKLKAKGLAAFSRHVEVPDKGKWHRIYIGKYATKQDAVEDINRLKQMQVSTYFAIRRLTEEKPIAKDATAASAVAKEPSDSKARPVPVKAVDYYLFVGYYRDLAQARNEVTRLSKALGPYGYRAMLTREVVADGMIYRVYVGTFSDRRQAADAGVELKGNKILTSFYTPVQTPQDMIAGRMPSTAAAATVATAEAADAETTENTSDKPKSQTAAGRPDEESAVKSTPTAAGTRDFSPFTVMLKGGAYSLQNVNKFAITDLTNLTSHRISDEFKPQIGVEGTVRFNKIIGLYGNADAVFISNIDWYNFSAGPVLNFQASENVIPYLKGGAVYGNFSWNNTPGEFDSSFGWEVGAGLNFLESKFKIGIDFNYRDISFDYKAPNDPSVSATEDSIDLSGWSLMGTISYWF